MLDRRKFLLLMAGSAIAVVPTTRLLAEIAKPFEESLQQKPQDIDTLIRWGTSLLQKGRDLVGVPLQQISKIFVEANSKFDEVLAIKPKHFGALYNLGNGSAEQGRLSLGDEAVSQFNAASRSYLAAFNGKVPAYYQPMLHHNWGAALSDHAKIAAPDERETMFKAARRKYHQALALNPHHAFAQGNIGASYADEARFLSGAAALEKFALAEENLLAHKAVRNKSKYNLACLYALTFRPELAIVELNACINDKTLPHHSYVLVDVDFEIMLNRADFREVIEHAQAAEAAQLDA